MVGLKNMVPAKQLIRSAAWCSTWASCNSVQYPQWSGLQKWRDSSINQDRLWGQKGPQPLLEHCNSSSDLDAFSSLSEMGALVLSTPDPLQKSMLSHLAFSKWKHFGLPVGVCSPPVGPSRPSKPQLVSLSLVTLLCFAYVFSNYWLNVTAFSMLLIIG